MFEANNFTPSQFSISPSTLNMFALQENIETVNKGDRLVNTFCKPFVQYQQYTNFFCHHLDMYDGPAHKYIHF